MKTLLAVLGVVSLVGVSSTVIAGDKQVTKPSSAIVKSEKLQLATVSAPEREAKQTKSSSSE